VLKEDKSIAWVNERTLFGGRKFRLVVGKRLVSEPVSEAAVYRVLETQMQEPVQLNGVADKRDLWMFRDRFYWSDEDLASEDVMALALERERERERRLSRARNMMHAPVDEDPFKRLAIPQDVKDAVWRRDEGRCARCGSRERLEFDHIIPVSRGGSNTARNIELLCERCNREKGANI
jgi:hypothetical protein